MTNKELGNLLETAIKLDRKIEDTKRKRRKLPKKYYDLLLQEKPEFALVFGPEMLENLGRAVKNGISSTYKFLPDFMRIPQERGMSKVYVLGGNRRSCGLKDDGNLRELYVREGIDIEVISLTEDRRGKKCYEDMELLKRTNSGLIKALGFCESDYSNETNRMKTIASMLAKYKLKTVEVENADSSVYVYTPVGDFEFPLDAWKRDFTKPCSKVNGWRRDSSEWNPKVSRYFLKEEIEPY
jgi:hypothetical protein|tara:strand:- start:149 stop:868 length:720 start_codon:yes stop_codon:yes gene_type:complete